MTTLSPSTRLRSYIKGKWRKKKINKDVITVGDLLNIFQGLDNDNKRLEKRIKDLEKIIEGL